MSFGTMLVHTTNAWEDQPCPALADQWDGFSTDYGRYDDDCDVRTPHDFPLSSGVMALPPAAFSVSVSVSARCFSPSLTWCFFFDVQFGADLGLSVDVCASYQNPELFSLSYVPAALPRTSPLMCIASLLFLPPPTSHSCQSLGVCCFFLGLNCVSVRKVLTLFRSSLDDFGLPALSCTTLLVETQPERSRKRLRESSDAEGLPSKKLRTADVEQPLAPPALPVSGLEQSASSMLLPSPDTPSAPSSPNEPASSPSCVSPKALFSPVNEYATSTNDFGFGDLGFEDVYVPRRRTTRAQSKLLQPLAPTKKQRNKLARDIAVLTVDKLQEIVKLVYPNAGPQQGDIDVEFGTLLPFVPWTVLHWLTCSTDIADVDDKLFHSLREFVDSCTKNTQGSTNTPVRKRTSLFPSSKSLSSSNNPVNSTPTIKSSPVSSPSKSAKTSRKRPRKGKKTKVQSPEPQPAPVAVPRSLTQAEVVIFERQEVLTLAQTESAEEDEFVDIGE